MNEIIVSLGAFAMYFGSALLLTVIFAVIYTHMTPHNELKLMREGNAAAALGLGGAVLGFALPLALVISVSHELSEAVIWGAVALLVQIAGHAAARMVLPTLNTDIAAGKFSAATVQVSSRLRSACCKRRAGRHEVAV